jgi:hypothetical protein
MPATTPEAREHQLIAAATDLAERQIHDGTASAQVISHYLKLGSTREKLEQQKLQEEVVLLRAKVESLQTARNVESLYADAIAAMKSYSGHQDESFEDPIDEYYD